MRKFILYFSAVLVLLALGLWVYIQSHQPQLRGKLKLEGLEAPVDVYYDDYGVPHIYASNSADAYRTFGYVHAQDRLFQMELMRRVGEGRLAEMFGPELSKTDAFFRTIGTNRKAKEDLAILETLPTKTQSILKAYIDGVNLYIENGKLPLEYALLGIEPEPFDLADIFAIEGYMAYSFAFALRTDPLVEYISKNLGPDYLNSLDLALPDEGDTIPDLPMEFTGSNTSLAFLDELPVPQFHGSNSWVVSPKRTLSAKPIIANDTHIKYSSPAAFYEAHIEYPGFGFYGNYIAGIPFALVGHSRNHAWGLTMFEDDDSDFFTEVFASADSSSTVYNDSLTKPVSKITERIIVNGAPDTVITVYETYHGPLVNSFLPIQSSEPISMYWNYTAIKNTMVEAFSGMNYSRSFNDFESVVSLIGSPGLNVTYADAEGNIAMWSASKLVKRGENANGKTYASGSSGKDEFQGFYEFSNNPHTLNPQKGFIVSANQMHDSTEGVIYPGYYCSNNRFDRITNELEGMMPVTVDSMQALILDVRSEAEAFNAHTIAAVIDTSGEILSDREEIALELLRTWSGQHRLRDQEPTLYYKTLYYVLKKALSDEMGVENFEDFLKTHLFHRSYPKILSENDSPWWDDLKTKSKKEERSEIFIKAFRKAMAELSDQLGEDISEWRWERVHTTTHEHPLGKVDALAPFFNVGPYPTPGGHETINNAGFILNGSGEYKAYFGPAMRIVLDFGDIENAVSILPTGNSGNVMSPHYNDQVEMYNSGEFRKMMMNEKEIKRSSNILRINPK